MEEMLDRYKRELEQKDREILRLARYAQFLPRDAMHPRY